jgi:hypothetical protein
MPLIREEHLDAAVTEGIVTRDQARLLWTFLAERAAPAGAGPAGATPAARRFTFANVLYYLGGMLAIGAMSLFMTLGWEAFGGWGIFALAAGYFVVVVALAARFERGGHDVPMGLMAALAVVLVPLATWGLQHALGFWVDAPRIAGYRSYHAIIDWRWIVLELATLAAAAVLFWRFRAPFLLMPVAVTLWYMSMDVGMFLVGTDATSWSGDALTFRKQFSLAFGLVMLLVAFWVDLRSSARRDYAFWLYLFGLLTAWGAFTSMGSGQLAGKLFYLAVNVGLVLLGAALGRRVFTVFGGIGVALVLGNLSWSLFRDSWLFPFVLTLLGFAIIGLALWWSRHEARLVARVQAALPEDLRSLIAARRAGLAG